MTIKQVNLDIWNTNNIIVYANSGEVDCRYIEVSFKDDSQNNISLSNKSVTFYAKKPDDTTIFNYCTVDTTNNTATVELTSQTLSVPGILECEFQIFNGDNVLLKVDGLKISVSNSNDFSQAVESESESNVLTSLINNVNKNSEAIGNLANLTTTKKSNVVSAINELNGKIISSHILYSNSSGSSSTITLSSSAANYKYIEIYYFKDLNQIISTKIYNPNSKAATLGSVTFYANALFLRAAIVDINETAITWRSSDSGWGTVSTGGNTISSEQVFKICQVIGYR